jgi:uncharacterized repeat protein (TIGR03803 family)
MHSKKPTIHFLAACAVLFSCLTNTTPASAASTEKIVHAFKENGKDGFSPQGSLIFDTVGNLYGTAFGAPYGGNGYGKNGAVFQLKPGADGKWSEKVLHSFCAAKDCTDGKSPNASLIIDAAGNLYGTTEAGGASGMGTVFRVKPHASGRWTETVLHSFNGTDGRFPLSSLILDAHGNLYGTTYLGGAKTDNGTVFELTPGAGDTWTEKVLYSFCAVTGCLDGTYPGAGVILDSLGNLYGTTFEGGTGGYGGYGTVFEVSPRAGGKWAEKVLHSFDDINKSTEGFYPWGSLVIDAAGNLYGTTARGGADRGSGCFYNAGCGTVFKLTPEKNGKWKEKVLHSFTHNGVDGYSTEATLVFDTAGNLYGTAELGGSHDNGAIFQLKAGTSGKWQEKVIFSFGQSAIEPWGGLTFDTAGNMYGTTLQGGNPGTDCKRYWDDRQFYGCGTVFEITR